VSSTAGCPIMRPHQKTPYIPVWLFIVRMPIQFMRVRALKQRAYKRVRYT